MKAIPREAGRVTYSTDIRNRKKILLDEYQRAVLVGSILGDACLHENWSKTNFRLQIRHSVEQEEYVRWKYKIFSLIVLTSPQLYQRTHSWWFRTISHPELTTTYRLFYRDGKKIIPQNISNYLSDSITIAVWFMDDGNGRKYKGCVNGFDLNTRSFTLDENQRLIEVLRKKWNLICTINKNNGYYRLHVLSHSVDKFRDIIRPHIISSMSYKIG